MGILNTPLELWSSDMSDANVILSVWILVTCNLAVSCMSLGIVIRVWRMAVKRRPCEEEDISL